MKQDFVVPGARFVGTGAYVLGYAAEDALRQSKNRFDNLVLTTGYLIYAVRISLKEVKKSQEVERSVSRNACLK